jgi:hypothetical protein
MNTRAIAFLFAVSALSAGQLPPAYSLANTSLRYSAHDLPEIAIDISGAVILIARTDQNEVRLHKRPGFDFGLPLESAPDVHALRTPGGICVSIYFKPTNGGGFYVYILGDDVWLYKTTEPSGWMHWATGELSAKTPPSIENVFNLLKEGASPSSDPFAGQADGVAPMVVNPQPETPAPR